MVALDTSSSGHIEGVMEYVVCRLCPSSRWPSTGVPVTGLCPDRHKDLKLRCAPRAPGLMDNVEATLMDLGDAGDGASDA